jgi:hypothetical protein
MKKKVELTEGEQFTPQIVSINERSRLKDIQKEYPKLPVIIGAAEKTDKPAPMDLADMDHQRVKQVDSATESVLGKRVDKLERPQRHPTELYCLIIGFLAGVGSCYIFYNIMLGG